MARHYLANDSLVYAGVEWSLHMTRSSGGPGLPPENEMHLVGVDLLDPDAWHDETTAYPFTDAGVRDWFEREGDAVIFDIVTHAQRDY
jgi:hypothetical protein